MSYVTKLRPHEFKIWKGAKKPLLGQLDIELTERCNNVCVHCCINLPENDPQARAREMSTEDVKSVINQAVDLGCLTIRFTGGEPLLRPDLPELYLFTRKLGVKVILFTNARLITEEFAALLARIKPGRVVEVTVYGMRPETYDQNVCQKGAFEEFRRGLSLLETHQIPFIVKAPYLKNIQAEQEEFEAWAKTIPWLDHTPSYSMNFDLRSRRDDPAKSARIAKLRVSPEDTVRKTSSNPLYKKDMAQFCSKFMGPPGEKLFRCGAGHGSCVDPYGKAQMCLPLRTPESCYDLFAEDPSRPEGMSPLKYALTEFFPRMTELTAENPEYLRRCARCFLKGLCEQCPAKSWVENGTFDTPVEYLCEVAHAQARELGLISETEKAWEVDDWRERIDLFAQKYL